MALEPLSQEEISSISSPSISESSSGLEPLTPLEISKLPAQDKVPVIKPIFEGMGVLAPNKPSELQQRSTEALPFRGFGAAFEQGYKTGQDVLGKNLGGKILGSIFGASLAPGTAFNPISTGARYYTNLSQSLGELLGGSPELATGTLTGSRKVIPTFGGAKTSSTTVNFVTDIAAEAANDPINAALILEGLSSPKTAKTIQKLPSEIKGAATAVKDVISNTNLDTLKTSKDQFLASALDIQPSDIKRLQKLEDGSYAKLIPVVQEKFTPNSGAKGAVKAIGEVVGEQLDKIHPEIATADSAYINKPEIISKLDTALAERNFTSSQITDLINHFRERINETTPENLVGFTKRLGEEANALYQGVKRPELNTDTIQAAADLRDVYSDVIKNILQDKGIPPSAYSATGQLMDMQNLINKNYLQSFGETQSGKGQLLREKLVPNATSRSPATAAQKTAKGYIAKLLIDSSKVLDKKVNNIFNDNSRPLSSSNPSLQDQADALKLDLSSSIQNSIQNQTP